MGRKWHVRADGSMGPCTAKDGNCPFGGEEGTRHFGNEAEARRYSEERIKAVSSGKALGASFRKTSRPGGTVGSGKRFSDMVMPTVKTVDYDVKTPFGDARLDRIETDLAGNCYVIMKRGRGDGKIPESMASAADAVLHNMNDGVSNDGGKWYGVSYFDGQVLMVDEDTDETYKVDSFTKNGISASGKSIGRMHEDLMDEDTAYSLPVTVASVGRDDAGSPDFGAAAMKPDGEVLPVDVPSDGWNPVPVVEANLREFGVEGTMTLHIGNGEDSPDYVQVDLADGSARIDYSEDVPLRSEKVIQAVRRSYQERDPQSLTESERASVDLMGRALKNSGHYKGADWALDNKEDLDRLNKLFYRHGFNDGQFDRHDPEFHWTADEIVRSGRCHVEELVTKAHGDSHYVPTDLRFGRDWNEVDRLTRKLHITLPDDVYED